MSKQRRQHNAKYQFQVILDIMREAKTVREIAKKTDIPPNLIPQWKGQLLEGRLGLFVRDSDRHHSQFEQQEIESYE